MIEICERISIGESHPKMVVLAADRCLCIGGSAIAEAFAHIANFGVGFVVTNYKLTLV